MRAIFLICLFAVAAVAQNMPPIEPGVSHELAKWRASQYSNVRYNLNLTLEKMSPVLKGTIEIRLQYAAVACAEPNCPPRIIVLDWRKIKGHEEKSTVSNVTLNGSELRLQPRESITPKGVTLNYEERDEHLIFRDGVQMGENVIKLDFTSPILTSGSAITRYVDKEDGAEYIYSLFVPSDASTAFPVFDQPDLKARFTLDVYCSQSWKVISNSPRRVRKSHDYTGLPGVQTERFVETKPISTYVFAFAAGPWERVSEPVANVKAELKEAMKNAKPFSTIMTSEEAKAWREGNRQTDLQTHAYVRKSQAAKFKPHAAEVFRLNREGIKYLETYFDYKFPFPKYDIVLIPEFPFGGMEHAGATFLREDRVIFPQEPTKNDHITRANLIFHEAAHQWFGDTVTMKWFDDLWLKEGFAEFMAYKTLEKVMPEYNAWKIFYERNKQAAYLTDSTKGTTPIYREIANLNAAKSAYGNIVYRKAPSFLKQAEFYLGEDKSFGVREDKFQTAVRAFLKKHEFANAGWEDLVKEFETASGKDLKGWANAWIKQRGVPTIRLARNESTDGKTYVGFSMTQRSGLDRRLSWAQTVKVFQSFRPESRAVSGNLVDYDLSIYDADRNFTEWPNQLTQSHPTISPNFVFPNYGDYGYGIFLLDDKSRDYVLKNIHNEKDAFLRSMMWGSLWDSVREAELDPKEYVELVVKNIKVETDESTIQTLLGRVSTAMRYYLSEPGVVATGFPGVKNPVATAPGTDLTRRVEDMLIDRMQNASTPGQRITYYRAFLNIGESANARRIVKVILKGGNASVSERTKRPAQPMRAGSPRSDAMKVTTKDRFDIVARLIILGDAEAPKLLADLEKSETSDEAKRYAYAARAGIATADNKAKFWTDFTTNKEISESWIEAAFGPFNSIRHNELTLPYLQRALQELPNHKRNRKIFFVNGWLAAFIGGQRSEAALNIVNKFLADNPDLDKDLRLKILENVDLIERAVKIRGKFAK